MKVTVIGDIMCEPPILKAAEKPDGTYNFDAIFSKVSPMFQQSDYVIGNMEFPLAGVDAEYTDSFFVFNAPDTYATAIKNAGIDLVSTVNNHTLDRGADGMVRTMRVLDEIDLSYVGTTLPEKEREGAYHFEVDGTKFAVVAYTYNLNNKLPEDDICAQRINRFAVFGDRRCGIQIYPKNWVDYLLWFLPLEKRKNIKKRLGLPYLNVQVDSLINHENVDEYIARFSNDVKKAKKTADFVICYLHTGGQFNEEIGDFSKYVFEKALEAGADAVLACHSHTVQKAMMKNGIVRAYSLGNFSMVPDSPVTVGKQLPEFCLAMHLYITDKQTEKVTFSILRAVQKPGEQLIAWPVDELYQTLTNSADKKKLEDEVRHVYQIVTGKTLESNIFQREYDLV